jgi:hypothetical protein
MGHEHSMWLPSKKSRVIYPWAWRQWRPASFTLKDDACSISSVQRPCLCFCFLFVLCRPDCLSLTLYVVHSYPLIFPRRPLGCLQASNSSGKCSSSSMVLHCRLSLLSKVLWKSNERVHQTTFALLLFCLHVPTCVLLQLSLRLPYGIP